MLSKSLQDAACYILLLPAAYLTSISRRATLVVELGVYTMPEQELLTAIFRGRRPQRAHHFKADRYPLGRLTPRLAPTEAAASNDFRWAAGFYEGEGSCHGDFGTILVSVSQKDRWAVERMRALFGGSIGAGRKEPPIWRWQISGARARGFIQSIYGLLSPRRQEQVRKAMMDGLGSFTSYEPGGISSARA